MSRHLLSLCYVTIILAAPAPTDVSSGINSFAHKLYNVVSTKDSNLIFSPFSVHAALSFAYQGAAGETARSFQNSLGLPERTETAASYKSIMTSLKNVEKVDIRIANKIYVKSGYKLNENFRSVAVDDFRAGVEAIDFTRTTDAASNINAWVKDQTNDRIKDLVTAGDFDESTAAVLLNAIYFKGNWLRKFNTKHTHPEKFYVSESDSVDCQIMRQMGNFEYGESANLDAKVLKLKYADQRFGMTIVLPNSKTGIDRLEKKLGDLDINGLSTTSTSVSVYLPRFKVESSIILNEPLKKLGLGDIFSENADFSNMLDSKEPLQVSKAIQKAFVEVNEEGSEAAAATAIIVTLRMSRPLHHPKVFKADHPFIFYITANLGVGDNAQKVLFMGKMVSP